MKAINSDWPTDTIIKRINGNEWWISIEIPIIIINSAFHREHSGFRLRFGNQKKKKSNEENKKKILTWVIRHSFRSNVVLRVCTENVRFWSQWVYFVKWFLFRSYWSLPWHWQLLQITFAVVNNTPKKGTKYQYFYILTCTHWVFGITFRSIQHKGEDVWVFHIKLVSWILWADPKWNSIWSLINQLIRSLNSIRWWIHVRGTYHRWYQCVSHYKCIYVKIFNWRMQTPLFIHCNLLAHTHTHIGLGSIMMMMMSC